MRHRRIRRPVFRGLRQAKVQHFDSAVRLQLHVGGFEVSMNNAFFVRGFERFADLFRDGERVFNRNRSVGDGPSQRFAFDQFEDEKTASGLILKVVDRSDVRMI